VYEHPLRVGRDFDVDVVEVLRVVVRREHHVERRPVGRVADDRPELVRPLRARGLADPAVKIALHVQRRPVLATKLRDVGKRGYEEFKVDSTPTVFINGQVYKGEMTPEAMEKALAPMVKG